MNLSHLPKPARDAALIAADSFRHCNVNSAADRGRFRDAKQQLADLLPDGADASDIIIQAVRWDSANQIAAILEGIEI